MNRTQFAFQSVCRRSGNVDPGAESFRIHFCRRRNKRDVAVRRFELFDIRRFRSRVLVEILVRPELGRVDKHGRDGNVAFRLGVINEADMSRMKRAHCRDKPDGFIFFSPLSGKRRHF